MSESLIEERTGAVVRLTLNRPDVRNALTGTGNTLIDELVAACERINADASVRVMVLTAAGKVFSSGGNLKDMLPFASGEVPEEEIREWYRTGIHRLVKALYGLEVPSIAAVNGPAIGAGCDLACMCDMRIASESASFAESFVRVGLISGDGGAWLLPRAVGRAKAMEMAFTGDPVDAAEALRCGLVSTVVPGDKLMDTAEGLARRIARNPGRALRMSKRLIRQGEHADLDTLLEHSGRAQAIAHRTPQHREAIQAFMEKRDAVFGDD